MVYVAHCSGLAAEGGVRISHEMEGPQTIASLLGPQRRMHKFSATAEDCREALQRDIRPSLSTMYALAKSGEFSASAN